MKRTGMYDNKATMCHECWKSGKVTYFITARMLAIGQGMGGFPAMWLKPFGSYPNVRGKQ